MATPAPTGAVEPLDPTELARLDAYWRAAAAIAAATTTLPGFDALVFTGGIGERSGPIGSRIVRRLAALGLDPLDERESDDDDDGILGFGHAPAVLRIAAREDIVLAEAVAAVLG